MASEGLDFLPEMLDAYIKSLEKAAKNGSKEEKQKLKDAQATYKKLKKTQAKIDSYAKKLQKPNLSKEASKVKSGISKLMKKLNEFIEKRRDKKIANLSNKVAELQKILKQAAQTSEKFLEEAGRISEGQMPQYDFLGLAPPSPPNNEKSEKDLDVREKDKEAEKSQKAKEAILGAFNELATSHHKKSEEPEDLIVFDDVPSEKQTPPQPQIQQITPAPIQEKMPEPKKVTVKDVMRAVLDPNKTDKEREDALRSALSLPGAADAMQSFIASSLGTAQRQGGQKLLGDAEAKPAQVMNLDPKQVDMLVRTFSAVWKDPGVASEAVTAISNRNPQVGRMLIEGIPAAGPMPTKAPEMIELPSSQELEEQKPPQEAPEGQQPSHLAQATQAIGGVLKYMIGWGGSKESKIEEPKKPSPTPHQDEGKEAKNKGSWSSWLGFK